MKHRVVSRVQLCSAAECEIKRTKCRPKIEGEVVNAKCLTEN